MRWLVISLSLNAVAGCGDSPDKEVGSDTGAASSDSSPPTETGDIFWSDTGTVVPSGYEGVIRYTSTLMGDPWCASIIGLNSAPWEGDCEGCDFALSIDATVVSDRGETSCERFPPLAMVDEEFFSGIYVYDFLLAYQKYGGHPALTTAYGVTVTYYGEVYGTYPSPLDWYFIGYDSLELEGSVDAVAWDGETLSWSLTFPADVYPLYEYGFYCLPDVESTSTAPVDGTYIGTGDLPCDTNDVFDVWSLYADEGQTVSVTVNTLADETAFTPFAWVSDRTGCVLSKAEENFPCTFGDVSCPTLTTALSGEGPFQIGVMNEQGCDGRQADYMVIVNAPEDPGLVQSRENLPEELHSLVTVQGHLTPR